MSLSAVALIATAMLVTLAPCDADTPCGAFSCPPTSAPDMIFCCNYDSSNPHCCSSIITVSLAGWAIGVIVTGCILTVGGIFLCCLCCACCPVFQYRMNRQTTYVTTTSYQSVPQTAKPYQSAPGSAPY